MLPISFRKRDISKWFSHLSACSASLARWTSSSFSAMSVVSVVKYSARRSSGWFTESVVSKLYQTETEPEVEIHGLKQLKLGKFSRFSWHRLRAWLSELAESARTAPRMSQIQAGSQGRHGDQGQFTGQLSYAVDSYTHRVKPASHHPIPYFLHFTISPYQS